MAWISLLFQITNKNYLLFVSVYRYNNNRHSAIVDALNERAYENNSISSIVVLNLEKLEEKIAKYKYV